MSSKRWMKFWPQDWRGEPALRMCSMAARGLWMELLCIAHEAEPRGHVLVAGKSPSPKQLSGICGCPEKEVVQLLLELEDAGVFSRTEQGVIYSRRMVRDGEASDAGREAIKKRWAEDKGAKQKPTSPPNRGATTDPDSLEARSKNQDSPPTPQGGGTSRSRRGGGFFDGLNKNRISRLWNEHVKPENGSGKLVCAGYYWDITLADVLDAARIDPSKPQSVGVVWDPLIEWLVDGYHPQSICEIIREITASPNYRPAWTLKYFDNAIRGRALKVLEYERKQWRAGA